MQYQPMTNISVSIKELHAIRNFQNPQLICSFIVLSGSLLGPFNQTIFSKQLPFIIYDKHMNCSYFAMERRRTLKTKKTNKQKHTNKQTNQTKTKENIQTSERRKQYIRSIKYGKKFSFGKIQHNRQ